MPDEVLFDYFYDTKLSESFDMAKIQIKSEKLTSFGGIFPIMEKFDRMLSHTIVSTLGLRSKMPPSGTGNRISLYFFSPW